MSDTAFEMVDECAKILHLGFSAEEFASLAEEHNFSEEAISAVECVFDYMRERRIQRTVETLLRLSHLPLKNPKTFENFDFTQLRGREVSKLCNLQTLSAIRAHKNIALIGPAGTGKTHLAQAIGYECCRQKMQASFIKMSELNDKFTVARQMDNAAKVLTSLVHPSCLIIDEVGYCTLDKENTRLFFDMVDRRYNKEGCYNMVFTSNKHPSQWAENFSDQDAALCALDRIFDKALIFNLKGDSYRGRDSETIAVSTKQNR